MVLHDWSFQKAYPYYGVHDQSFEQFVTIDYKGLFHKCSMPRAVERDKLGKFVM